MTMLSLLHDSTLNLSLNKNFKMCKTSFVKVSHALYAQSKKIEKNYSLKGNAKLLAKYYLPFKNGAWKLLSFSMTQKKGKIFNDPSCSRQTLEGLLWEGFHFTPPPTNQLFTSRAFLRNTHTTLQRLSSSQSTTNDLPTFFLSRQLWSEPGLSADQILKTCVTLGTSFISLVSPRASQSESVCGHSSEVKPSDV